MKSIIVYFSRTGRTAKVARAWAHKLAASRLEIVPMAWRNTFKENLEYYAKTLTRQHMEIDLYKVDFEKYDRIVLMIPVIFGMMSAPMRTFIRQEAGNLHNVEYVIIYKGMLIRRKSLVKWLDKTLGEKHVACSTIWEKFNKDYKTVKIDGESILK